MPVKCLKEGKSQQSDGWSEKSEAYDIFFIRIDHDRLLYFLNQKRLTKDSKISIRDYFGFSDRRLYEKTF
jgi:hypothetical protein